MFKRVLILSLLLIASVGSARAQYDLNHFYYAGRQSLADGKFAQAIENFNILSRLDSLNYESYFFRGIAKYNLGDLAGAKMDFDLTVHFNPVYTPAYHYRAITLSQLGKYEEALKDLEEAVDLRPSYLGLYFSRGVTYFLSQQFELAIADFDRFIRKEPREGDAYLNRGASYLFLGDTISAMRDYNKAISLNRNDPEGYIRRSRVYGMQNNLVAAVEDMNVAIRLDTTNTYAYFNRAILLFEQKKIQEALSDFDRVLRDEPGNALTLYNRALVYSQVGDYRKALDDYDRVLNINPNNVLAYYNRAYVFMEMGRYREARDDYSQAIDLYPDFAQAYLNRAYAKNMLGQSASSKRDYDIAQKKIAEYKSLTKDSSGRAAFADTSRKYNNLLSLDADFAKKDFENELLQYRDVDIRLKPLYKFFVTDSVVMFNYLTRKYDDPRLESFVKSIPLPVNFLPAKALSLADPKKLKAGLSSTFAGRQTPEIFFAKALLEIDARQFNSALALYDEAIKLAPSNPFLYLNRGALHADMIEFLSSIGTSVQSLSMDNTNTARTRVQDRMSHEYDYSQALSDMLKAAELDPESPFIQYNLGNLFCLCNDLPESIARYSAAIKKAPTIGEAYYNRGLVLIYLKDKDKGCIDLSVAGELGVADAYSVIKKYCKTEER